MFIKSIKLNFLFPSKNYLIQGLRTLDNNYVLLINQENNELYESYHEISPTKIFGLRLVLKAYHETKSFYNGQYFFGIRLIKLYSSFSNINLIKCSNESDSSEEIKRQNFFVIDYKDQKNKTESFFNINGIELIEKYENFDKKINGKNFTEEYLIYLNYEMNQMVYKL